MIARFTGALSRANFVITNLSIKKLENMKTLNKTTNLNKGLVTVCLSFIFCTNINAQDKILLRSGDELNAKVTEITETEVKFKKFDNLNGPTHVIYKSDVFSIKYENGTKDVFNNSIKVEVSELVESAYVMSEFKKTNSPADNTFDPDTSDFAKRRRKTFSGPRIGFTYISSGTAADYLARQGKQNFVTQFGWQFEGRLFTVENGMSGIIEFVPLIGGIEQGMFIPSVNLLIGLRGGEKRSYEFAMGPHFSVVPNYLGQHKGSVGLVIAAGTSFKKGNVNFPVNLAFVPSVGSKENVMNEDGSFTEKKFQTGWRLSLIVGFNSRKK